MISVDGPAALDHLIWLRTGQRAAEALACTQPTVSRNSRKCLDVFELEGAYSSDFDSSLHSKDRPRHQHPEWVLHHAALCALRHLLDCWCCLNAHWLPLTSIPQCSQVVDGTALTQLAVRSPTSSRLAGSMPRAF